MSNRARWLVLAVSLSACLLSKSASAQAVAAEPSQGILYTLFACGLMGTIGQTARVAVGMKTLSDSAAKDGLSASDLFSLARLITSLIIGFLAGVITALVTWKAGNAPLKINLEDFDTMFRFVAAGYIGVDVIEAFTTKYFEKTVPPVAPTQLQRAVAGLAPAELAPIARPAAPANVPGTDYPTWALIRDMKQAKAHYWSAITEGSETYGLPIALIGAIGSKESHWGLLLKPPGPAGTGDFAKRDPGKWGVELPSDGGGWGRGLMQIDWYSHEFARTGDWQDPTKNVLFGCDLLSSLLKSELARGLDHDTALRSAVSAYNGSSGPHSAYSTDVMARADWIKQQGLDRA